MDSNEFSCSSSFVVIKLYISHIKKNKSFFPSITWISASLQKQEDEVIKNFFMVGPDWFWVGAAVKQHKEKPTPLSFFPRNTALKKKKKKSGAWSWILTETYFELWANALPPSV